MLKKAILTIIIGFALCMVIGSSASADTMNFQIAVGNDAVSSFPPSYLDVTINRTSSTMATFTVDSLSHDGYAYYFGGSKKDGFAINLNYSILDNISVTFDAYTPKDVDYIAEFKANIENPGGNMSDFGRFIVEIGDGHADGWANGVLSQLVFTVIDTGASWASVSDVLCNNAKNYLAAAHVFIQTPEGGVVTGFAGNGEKVPPPQVPEPATMLFLGLGLLGIAGVGRKIKK